MIDYVTVIYKNYDLLDLQIYNFKKRFQDQEYRVFVVDNTPNGEKKQNIQLPDNFILVNRDNPHSQEFDGISHGAALDYGVTFVESDIVGIIDSDFFILNNNIHRYINEYFLNGFKAVGSEYNDGDYTRVWVSKNPSYFENIPCCFGSYYAKEIAKADTWIITPGECEEGKKDGFVEVGVKIRKYILNNKIKTTNWKTSSVNYGNCYFMNDAGETMGIHYVAGSHRRWNGNSINELKNIIDSY